MELFTERVIEEAFTDLHVNCLYLGTVSLVSPLDLPFCCQQKANMHHGVSQK
jgi:hypothetical protein